MVGVILTTIAAQLYVQQHLGIHMVIMSPICVLQDVVLLLMLITIQEQEYVFKFVQDLIIQLDFLILDLLIVLGIIILKDVYNDV